MTAAPYDHLEALRRLALNDERFLAAVLSRRAPGGRPESDDATQVIDDRTKRLVDLGALIAIGSGPVGIEAAVSAALGAGATEEDVVDVLLSIAPAVGSSRIVDCAPSIAAGISYDMDADFDELKPYPPSADGWPED